MTFCPPESAPMRECEANSGSRPTSLMWAWRGFGLRVKGLGFGGLGLARAHLDELLRERAHELCRLGRDLLVHLLEQLAEAERGELDGGHPRGEALVGGKGQVCG